MIDRVEGDFYLKLYPKGWSAEVEVCFNIMPQNQLTAIVTHKTCMTAGKSTGSYLQFEKMLKS